MPSKSRASSNRPRRPRTRRGGLLSDGPSYVGQQVSRLVLPGSSGLVSANATGDITSSVAVDTTAILNFGLRFGSTFEEYRVLGVDIKIRPVALTAGLTSMWFDEKSGAIPTSAEAFEKTHDLVPNTNASSNTFRVMRWRARDLLDLQYLPIGTVFTPVWFKLLTSTAGYGTPAVAAPVWFFELDFHVEFRGLKAV